MSSACIFLFKPSLAVALTSALNIRAKNPQLFHLSIPAKRKIKFRDIRSDLVSQFDLKLLIHSKLQTSIWPDIAGKCVRVCVQSVLCLNYLLSPLILHLLGRRTSDQLGKLEEAQLLTVWAPGEGTSLQPRSGCKIHYDHCGNPSLKDIK